jgi:hypothetical protein
VNKKDYTAIAAVLKAHKPDPRAADFDGYWNHLVSALMDVFVADNSKFHRGKFLAACGVPNIGLK